MSAGEYRQGSRYGEFELGPATSVRSVIEAELPESDYVTSKPFYLVVVPLAEGQTSEDGAWAGWDVIRMDGLSLSEVSRFEDPARIKAAREQILLLESAGLEELDQLLQDVRAAADAAGAVHETLYHHSPTGNELVFLLVGALSQTVAAGVGITTLRSALAKIQAKSRRERLEGRIGEAVEGTRNKARLQGLDPNEWTVGEVAFQGETGGLHVTLINPSDAGRSDEESRRIRYEVFPERGADFKITMIDSNRIDWSSLSGE
ncbi:hypothetical protein ABZS98_35965 [Streptomyces avermitilis]|uniref:hypothetical protein n=1 Tax=Streptomyces avermitilis TaxID=33903 RepID=UPI0033A70FCC